MSNESHTGGDEFWAGGDDGHIVDADTVEGHLVIRGGLFAILQFGLGDRGPEGDVPQGGSVCSVRLTALQVLEKGRLGNSLRIVVDGSIRQ